MATKITYGQSYEISLISGNIAYVSDLRYTGSGTAVMSFTLINNESWTDRQTGDRKEKANRYKVTLWGESAEQGHKAASVGREVVVFGVNGMDTEAYVDKNGEAQAMDVINGPAAVHFGYAKRDDSRQAGPDTGDGENIPF